MSWNPYCGIGGRGSLDLSLDTSWQEHTPVPRKISQPAVYIVIAHPDTSLVVQEQTS
jgi:hypothetical protein